MACRITATPRKRESLKQWHARHVHPTADRVTHADESFNDGVQAPGLVLSMRWIDGGNVMFFAVAHIFFLVG
jgi:hypothetical protein